MLVFTSSGKPMQDQIKDQKLHAEILEKWASGKLKKLPQTKEEFYKYVRKNKG